MRLPPLTLVGLLLLRPLLLILLGPLLIPLRFRGLRKRRLGHRIDGGRFELEHLQKRFIAGS